MAYITYSEFRSLNTGVEITESEFNTLYFYTEAAIDGYLGQHIDPPPDNVTRAAGMQIALAKMNGGIGYYSASANSTRLNSESVPDYSYSMSEKSKTAYSAAADTFGLFPIVLAMLGDHSIEPVEVVL